MKRKCPFCRIELNKVSSHIYSCNKRDLKLSDKEIKYKTLITNFPALKLENAILLKNLYIKEKKSLPEIREKYGIDFKSIIFLLNFFEMPVRNISEGRKNSQEKIIATCLKKYGTVNQLSRGTESYKKVKKTVRDRYGVSHVMKLRENVEKVRQGRITNYGSFLNYSDYLSKKCSDNWINKSEEEKSNFVNVCRVAWLNHSEETRQKIMKNFLRGISKLEISVSTNLLEIGFKIETQKYINGLYYDIYLPDLNTLIEVNGDFWHANPIYYKNSDELILPNRGKLKAEDIWTRDRIKYNNAIANKYKIIYLWENEIRRTKKNLQKFERLFTNKLNNI